VNVAEGRWMAEQIPDARSSNYPAKTTCHGVANQDSILDEMQEFLTGDRPDRESDRSLPPCS
jgi:hypothetical protein